MSISTHRYAGRWLPALAVAFAVALASCNSAPSSEPAAPSASVVACGRDDVSGGGIDGLVTDTDGTPLDDIFIQVVAGDGFTGSTRTGSDGKFEATDVAGRFTISTVDAHYAPATTIVDIPCGELVEVVITLTATGG